jgi:phospholipid/cholesterol/gamma-HCH transport system substrate-binding protein
MPKSVRVGAFVVITLAILALFVFLIGNTQSKFQANYRLQAQFQNVSGLEEGADVRLGGLHKGTVRKIELPARPDGKITVVMDLSRQTRNLIKQDSTADIKSEGLVGNKYVEISFGSVDAPEVPAGGTINSQPPLDISDLMGKASQILDSTKGTLDNLQVATANVSTITSKINNGRGTVGALINDKTVYQQATDGAAALREDADALKHNFLLRGFFKDHGFADPSEIQKYAIAKLPAGQPDKTFNYDAKKVFDKPDSAKLKNEKSLNEAGEFLQSGDPGLVVIEASAGPKGQSDKDRAISQARAYAVRAYLLDHFKLDDGRVKLLGLGKSESEATLRILVYNAPSSGPEK